ncbi:MAG: deoxycytidylate deaminase [Minisyncoccota bacterium]
MNLTVPDVLVAYVPTPHAGYLKLFRAHKGSVLYVLGKEFVQQFPSLVRNLPGVAPEESQKMIQALDIFADVRILTITEINDTNLWQSRNIIMPDEDVSHALAEKYFTGISVVFDNSWRLRWDWGEVTKERRPEGERKVSLHELDRAIMRQAFDGANRSPDWWRQIGALLVRGGKVLLVAYNRHVPNDQSLYCYGDPRSAFSPPGTRIEISSAMHAEMGIAAAALQRGICTEGCDLFVTTFPCPPCAYPWAHSGIRRLFYTEGYSLVAAAETLEAKDVEIIRVEM